MADFLPERRTTRKATLTGDDKQVILPENMQKKLSRPVTSEQLRMYSQPTTGIRGDQTNIPFLQSVKPSPEPLESGKETAPLESGKPSPEPLGSAQASREPLVPSAKLTRQRPPTREQQKQYRQEQTEKPLSYDESIIVNMLKSAGKGVVESADFALRIIPKVGYALPDIVSSAVGWSPFEAGQETFGSEGSIIPALWRKWNDNATKKDKDVFENWHKEWNEETWLKRYWLDPLTSYVFDPTSRYLAIPKSQDKPIYTAISLGTSVLTPFAGVVGALHKGQVSLQNMKRGVEVYRTITQPLTRTEDLFSASQGKVIHSMMPLELQFSARQALKLSIMEAMKFRAAPDKKLSQMESIHELVESFDVPMDPRLERSLVYRGKINDILHKNSGKTLEQRRKHQVAIYNNAMMAGGATAGYAVTANFTDDEYARLLGSLAGSIPLGIPRTIKKRFQKGKPTRFDPGSFHSNLTQKAAALTYTTMGNLAVSFYAGLGWNNIKRVFFDKGGEESFIKMLSNTKNDAFLKLLIGAKFNQKPSAILKAFNEGRKASKNALISLNLKQKDYDQIKKEIDVITEQIGRGRAIGKDLTELETIKDALNRRLIDKKVELDSFEKEVTNNKTLIRDEKTGVLKANSWNLVDQLIIRPKSEVENIAAMATAFNLSKDKKHILNLQNSLKSLTRLSIETGLDVNEILMAIGHASHATVFAQFAEGTLSRVHASFINGGLLKEKHLTKMLDNEIITYHNSSVESTNALAELLGKIAGTEKNWSKETRDFVEELTEMKEGKVNAGTSLNAIREGLMHIIRTNNQDPTVHAHMSYNTRGKIDVDGVNTEKTSAEFFTLNGKKKEYFGNDVQTNLDNHVSTFREDKDSLFRQAKQAFNNTTNTSGDVIPFQVELNPFALFGRTSISPLTEDQGKIFSQLSRVLYKNLGLKQTTQINPVVLSKQMRENALTGGSKEFSQSHSNLVETDIFEPYIQKAYHNSYNELKDQLFKLDDGSVLTGEKKYNKMIEFLINEPLDSNHIASQIIPMNIPIETLLDIRKRLRSNSFNSQSELNEIASSGATNADERVVKLRTEVDSMSRDIDAIDNAIRESIELTSDDVLKLQYKEAIEKYDEAKNFFRDRNNHYAGGEVSINVDNGLVVLDATGSPLHRINILLSKYGENNRPFEEYLIEFVTPHNKEYRIARHQFNMLAMNKDGTYDEKIVEQTIRSLQLIEDNHILRKNVLQDFSVWFDDVVDNVAETSNNGKKLKYHYENWKRLQRSHIKNVESTSAVAYTAKEAEIAGTLISYMDEVDRVTGGIFADSTIGRLTRDKETLQMQEIAEILTERINVTDIPEIINRYPKLKQILDEKAFNEQLGKELLEDSPVLSIPVGKAVDDEIERVAGEFNTKRVSEEIGEDKYITRLDVLMSELALARSTNKITNERYKEIEEFIKKALMTKMYNLAITKLPSGRLIDGFERHGDFKDYRKEYYDSIKGTGKEDDVNEFIRWLSEEKNISKEKLGSTYKLDQNINLQVYEKFLDDHKYVLRQLWPDTNDGRLNPHIRNLEEIFNLKLSLDSDRFAPPQIAGTNTGNYTEQMAAGRLYNAMKGVVSYRYLLMEAGFLKATAAQQGVLASIIRDKSMAEAVNKLFVTGVFDDKSFEIVWKKIILNLSRVGIMETALTKEEAKEEFKHQISLMNEDRNVQKAIQNYRA